MISWSRCASDAEVRKYVMKTMMNELATNSPAYQMAMRSPKRPERSRGMSEGGQDSSARTAGTEASVLAFAGAGGSTCRSPDDIPDTAHRLKQLRVEAAIDLVAQPTHEHVYDVGLRVEAVLPDVRQDHRLGDNLARVAHQVFEQRELARPQVDTLACARHLPRQQIHHQVAHRQRRRLRRARRAAHQCLDACEQFGKRERLRQVVVAACLQAANTIVDGPSRAQD